MFSALGYGTEHAAGAGHHQGSRHPLARRISHDEAQASLRKLEEVVEVSSHLPSWLVEGCDLPALQLGHALWERGLLDASRYPELLLYTLSLDPLLLWTLLRQLCEIAPRVPLIGDLLSHYAVDKDVQRFELFAGGHQAHPLTSVMGRAYGEGSNHLLPFCQLLLDDVAGVGEGGMKLGQSPQVALAGGLLAGYQVVVDEVGSEHLIHGI